MLVLSRNIGEKITIGDSIEICLVDIRGRKARFGITAPKEIKVVRNELIEKPIGTDSPDSETVGDISGKGDLRAPEDHDTQV